MLEDILLNHPNIADACVIGKPDLEAGELPRAYVVPVEGAKLSEKEVIDYVASKRSFVYILSTIKKNLKTLERPYCQTDYY